ncbi:hypothetical protein SCORR_v1c06120 [Spiroplasma corruscae]|uniref:Lipoprotein n=1 Tax=Spiroplasma corruscae TaxID=216934 RepID=A0A222EQ27_9MOLU|nr:hypothetical protein [Spiroplasma corruscae]ASP28384.1 hypothetical protein SCORR_v1c06120 [Spiroplasma corruscae]
MKKIIISLLSTSLIISSSCITTSCSGDNLKYGPAITNSNITFNYLYVQSVNNENTYTDNNDLKVIEWINDTVKKIKLYNWEISLDVNMNPKDNILLLVYKFDRYSSEDYTNNNEKLMYFNIYLFFNLDGVWKNINNLLVSGIYQYIVLKVKTDEGGMK